MIPEISKACQYAANSHGPLLFFIKVDGRDRDNAAAKTPVITTEIVSPRLLADNLKSHVWPLPLNWSRHLLRDNFSNMPAEYANLLLGHSHIGFEPLANYSGIALGSQMEAIRQQLDSMCSDYGIKALRGIP